MAGAGEGQRLRNGHFERVGFKGLGDQIGRLRPFARQQAFRIGGDEDDRHRRHAQDLGDRRDAGTAGAQIDIGEDEAGLRLLEQGHGLALARRNADDLMAEIADEAGDIQRDHRLVFNHEDRGRDLLVDRRPGIHQKRFSFRQANAQDGGGVGRREAFQRGEQQNLALRCRQGTQPSLDRQIDQIAVIAAAIDVAAGNGVEQFETGPASHLPHPATMSAQPARLPGRCGHKGRRIPATPSERAHSAART